VICPVAFRIDGRDLEIRPLNAAEAYEIAASGDWMRILPEALDEDGRDWVWERLEDRRDLMTVRSLWRIWHALAPDIYGVEWWSATRLASTRKVSWFSFESWTLRHGFEPDAPWVSPRRLSAALMTWLASTCEKDVEWQQLQTEILAPPEYAVYLPEDEDEAAGMDASSFQVNAPHWVAKAAAESAAPATEAGHDQEADGEAGQGEEQAPELPWAGQPLVTMDQFAAQAKEWVQSRRVAGESSLDEGG
jgi:hypothetical protein